MLSSIHPPVAGVVLPLHGCAIASGPGTAMPTGPRPAPLGPLATPLPAAAPARSTDATRAVLRHFLDLLLRRRQVCAAFECCVVAQGFRDHAWPGRGSRAGAMRSLARALADPDLQIELQQLVVDGDTGMAHLRCRDPQRGELHRVEIYRVADGRIAEHWSIADQPNPST